MPQLTVRDELAVQNLVQQRKVVIFADIDGALRKPHVGYVLVEGQLQTGDRYAVSSTGSLSHYESNRTPEVVPEPAACRYHR